MQKSLIAQQTANMSLPKTKFLRIDQQNQPPRIKKVRICVKTKATISINYFQQFNLLVKSGQQIEPAAVFQSRLQKLRFNPANSGKPSATEIRFYFTFFHCCQCDVSRQLVSAQARRHDILEQHMTKAREPREKIWYLSVMRHHFRYKFRYAPSFR